MASNEKKETGRDLYICHMIYNPNGPFSIGNARYNVEWKNVPAGANKKTMENIISECCQFGEKYVDEDSGRWPTIVGQGRPDLGYWIGLEEKVKDKSIENQQLRKKN